MNRQNTKQTVIIYLLCGNLVVTALLLLILVPKAFAATGCFPDTNGHWAETYICWMEDKGIAGGYPDGTFRPENRVTRAEMAVMLKNLYDAQNSRIAALENRLASVKLENGGKDLVFSGVNVHIRNGTGFTADTMNGLGNLIIGYNEDNSNDETRTGSHNLVLGTDNSYTSFSGIVSGWSNSISNDSSSVLGGTQNTASGQLSVILGGKNNTASSVYSIIVGGEDNVASDTYAIVSGGRSNTASGDYSSVSGGYGNQATWWYSSVSGGSVNTASGQYSSVSGGFARTVSGTSDWKAGTLFEDY